jgi:hypothetical protein
MCAHISSSSTSGNPMCRKTTSEKKRSDTAPSAMKLRTSPGPKPGSAPNHSVVAVATNSATVSQTIQ